MVPDGVDSSPPFLLWSENYHQPDRDMDRRKRDLLKLAEKEGLSNIEILSTKGCHYRIEGTHMGKLIKIIAPYSPSDYRNALNLRGNIRRAMRAVESVPVRA